MLAAENATCLSSRRLTALTGDMLPSECAREVVRSTSLAAFSMGPPNSVGLRACYPQDGLEELSYADVFYGTDDAICEWMDNPSFDFFVIEKQQPCSILGRGTSLIISNATAFSHRVSDDLERALSSYCSPCGDLMAGAVEVARKMLMVDVLVHRSLALASPGLRRIAAASMALGSALAVLLLTLLDAFSFLSLALEMLRLRSIGFVGSPLHFAVVVTIGQAVEQLGLLVLHSLIMAGMSFQLELANDFWPELHCTRSTVSSESVPNAWHQAARWTGTALVFFAAGMSVFFALCILGGYVYRFHGLVPAGWLASVLYNRDVKMTRFAAAPLSMSDYRHETLAVDPAEAETVRTSLLRPGLGVAASLGFWHQKMSYIFQVGRRLEWYLPALPDTDPKTIAFTSDCVSWMALVRATVQSLSVAWLLLPFGALPARACLYLNERILFAAGTDGGNSADEADALMQHALEDVGIFWQTSGWLAAMGHFVTLLLLLAVDFLILAHDPREQLIAGLLATGAGLAVLRAALSQLQGLEACRHRHGLVAACSEILQDALPSRVVQSHTRAQLKTHPRSRSEEQADALGIRPWHAGFPFVKAVTSQRHEKLTPLPVRRGDSEPTDEECLSALRGDAERVVSACRELLELDWVRSGLLPGRLRGKLVAARAARNRRIRLAQALLASRRPGFLARLRRRPAASSGLFYGALLMALREVAEEDLIAQRCASEARNVVCEHLRQHCTLQARKLQLWLHGVAQSQAARWAQALSLSGAVGDILEGLDSGVLGCNPCEVASEEPGEPGGGVLAAPADQQALSVQPAVEEKTQNEEEADDVLVSQDEDQEVGQRQQRLHAFLQSPGLPEESEAGVASATASATLPFDPATVRARATLQPQAWESRDAPQTLRMLFAVSQQGLIRISGHWAAGGREVLPEKQARVNITAKAEVVLHWPKSARPSTADVQVEFISHQIWPPLPRKPAAAGAGGLLTKRSDTRLRTPCRRRLGSSWAQQNDELRWWERQVAGRGWLLRRSPAAVSNAPNEEDRMDSLWRILCGVEWSACSDGHSARAGDEDSDGAVILPTELGQTRWFAPVALPALDPSQQEKFQPRCFSTTSGSGRDDLFQTAGRKLASTQVGGCVGLLGPVANVMQEPAAMDDEVLIAAMQAVAVAASAAAHAPRAALRALEVAMRRNPQQLGAAFLTSLYSGTGGLSQVEAVRRSWLMAAAARKLLKQKRARQAQQERSQFDAGLRTLSEQLLFWTASRERKRWLRTSEREPMGLTFLGKSKAPNWGILDVGSSSTSPAKSAKSGLDAAFEMAEPQDMDASFCSMARGSSGPKWVDSDDTHRSPTSRRSSQGSASGDRVTPFQCNAAAQAMVVTEVDASDDFDLNPAPRFRDLRRGSDPDTARMDEAQMQEGSRHIQQMVADFVQKASSHQADVTELEKTLEEARQGAVGSADLTAMQKAFEHLMALQRAALGLLESLQSGSIRQLESRLSMARELGLAPDAFPDAAGDGLLKLAAQKLEEQKAAAPGFLDTALDAFASHSSKKGVLGVGMIALQRCVDQARAAKIQDSTKLHRVEAKLHLLCERKREIALLKAAMAAEDAWLLKAATEECRQRFGEVTFGVDLTLAKCQLEIWERASVQAAAVSTTSEARRPSSLRLASQATSSEPIDLERSDVLAPLALGTPLVPPSLGPPVPAQEERAVTALRAAMFQEPPQAGLLRLAIARARRAGVAKEEVSKAEAVLQEEREAEQALEQLRRAAAARDVRALRRAIADCADAGVDQGRLLPASTQLCDALGELLKRAHQHGLALSVLTDLDRERQELRYSLAEKRSGLRTVCRVRPPLAPELQTALRSHAGLAPVLRRVDRRTLEVALASGSYATCDFSAVLGPESTQAEVSTELLGLAQAAIDGGNVAVIACGQRGAGKSFTLCGSADQPGVLPRLLEELFAIKSREHWRSDIHIDVQALEIVDDGPPTDLLSQASDGETVEQRIEAIRPCCVQGGPGQLCLAASAAIVSGAATRRAERLQELKDLVQDIWQQPSTNASRHAVLILQLTRRNRLTGVTCRSRLLVADLAGASSPAADRALSWAVACSARQGPRSLGVSSSNWLSSAGASSADGPGSQVLAALLQDCFGPGCTATMIVCLAPMAPDREGVLAVLEALGLRQSVVQTADTRAERRFQPPPEPLELPCTPKTPKLPQSPVLLQQMNASPAQSPTAQLARSSSNNSLFPTSQRTSVSDSESLEEEDL
ncbi:KIN14Q [Symbiodinium sp. CCMP2592]|nr:KIN14Q [Symbiodinium sp. CCMP2592]